MALAAKAETIRLFLPKSGETDPDASRFAGYFLLKALKLTKRERLVALRDMQNRFPIGKEVVYHDLAYRVEGVIPTVTAAQCEAADGKPDPDDMFTIRLIGADGILQRVSPRALAQEDS